MHSDKPGGLCTDRIIPRSLSHAGGQKKKIESVVDKDPCNRRGGETKGTEETKTKAEETEKERQING